MLDASGIIHVEGNRFLVAEDEIDILRYFVLNKDKRTFSATGRIDLGHDESDFESLAYDLDSQRYYCIGSHGQDYSKRLLGFQLEESEVSHITELHFDAQHLINEDVDIEALSTWGSKLFIGYRRPSLNKFAVAVLFDANSGAQLLTTFNLSGRTFRDIVRIDENNYLILAGPKKGKDYKTFPSCIFWWNGDVFSPEVIRCQVDLNGFRAEGIAIRICDDKSIDVLIGSDESKTELAECFRLLYFNVIDVPALINRNNRTIELQVKFK